MQSGVFVQTNVLSGIVGIPTVEQLIQKTIFSRAHHFIGCYEFHGEIKKMGPILRGGILVEFIHHLIEVNGVIGWIHGAQNFHLLIQVGSGGKALDEVILNDQVFLLVELMIDSGENHK